MQLEKLTFLDIENIDHLQPEGWTNLKDKLKFYTSNDFCNPIKIIDEDKIVGIGTAISFDKTAWLGHIIVGEAYRNMGIGFMIVEYLLNYLKQKGIETTLLLATGLGFPVYVKAGFKKVSDYRFFKKENILVENSYSNKIQSYIPEFYSQLIQLDTFISGENRERLLMNYLSNSFVFVENKTVRGFYIPELGDGPIFANTEAAGIELMRLKYSTVNDAVLPSENKTGIEFLQKCGFVEIERVGARMILGKEIAWKPEMVYSRIGGNFG